MTIERVTPAHRVDLMRVVLSMLKHGKDMATMEMTATLENATRLVDLILLPAAERGDAILLAYMDGILAGGLWWYRPDTVFEYKSVMMIGSTCVLPDFQRQGVGTRLRETGREILRALGAEYVCGVIDKHNPGAMESMGCMDHAEIGSYLRCKV